MGMFDTIRCEWPLPDAADGSDMQTKSLGCLLNHYVLGADGVCAMPMGRRVAFMASCAWWVRARACLWMNMKPSSMMATWSTLSPQTRPALTQTTWV